MTLGRGDVANNCYVRINSVEVDKDNGASDWLMTIDLAVYKDADTRNAKKTGENASDVVGSGAITLIAPGESGAPLLKYRFDYNPGLDHGDLIAVAYEKLKAHEDFSSASDV